MFILNLGNVLDLKFCFLSQTEAAESLLSGTAAEITEGEQLLPKLAPKTKKVSNLIYMINSSYLDDWEKLGIAYA